MNFIHHFSYAEYLDLAINGQPQVGSPSSRGNQSRGSRITTNSRSWYGTETWEAAVRLATEGWTEGREFMGKIVAKLDDIGTREITIPQPINDVSGDFVDIGAYLDGVPENMVRWEDVERPCRVARILFNMGTSGAISTEEIRWKGATVLALIDRLESSGVRVELDMVDVASDSGSFGSRSYSFITLKKAEEPLHLDRLAFHLAHPSSLRRLLFSVAECYSREEVERFDYFAVNGSMCGYGTPINLKASDPLLQSYDLIIPELHIDTVEKSVEAIRQMFSDIQ